MAGSCASGRQRKAAAKKIADGGYRPSRDGPLPVEARGLPAAPRAMKGREKEEWERLRKIRHLGPEDVPLATLQCRLWALLCQAIDSAAKAPADSDYRSAVKDYSTQYRATCTALGVTPVERAKFGAIVKHESTSVAARKRK